MPQQQIMEHLVDRIAFHRRWRLIWSVCYFVGASVTVIAGGLATASAGLITNTGSGKTITAALALTATVFASLEKVLKLREKWDLHRNSAAALEIIQLKLIARVADVKGIVALIEQVSQSYSLQLSEVDEAPSTENS